VNVLTGTLETRKLASVTGKDSSGRLSNYPRNMCLNLTAIYVRLYSRKKHWL